MSSDEKPVVFDDDNPEWTKADFVRAKRGEGVPAHIRAVFSKSGKPIGRPPGSDKERITIRVDKDTLARFRATGPGWQGRMNDALRRAKV